METVKLLEELGLTQVDEKKNWWKKSSVSIFSAGFRGKAAQGIEPGTKIRFSVSLVAAGAKLKLEGEGVVRWSWKNARRECLVGVEILTLSSLSHSLFTAWCRVRQPSIDIPKIIA